MKNEQPHPSHAGGSPVDQRVGRLPTEGTSLWPRPTLERAFAEMLEVDEQCREQMTAASKALSLAALASAELAQRAADTVRLSIMQRDNAAAELRAIGGQMANVCFNWSQEANSIGVRLAAGDREMLKSLHKQWDAAVARLKTPNVGGEARLAAHQPSHTTTATPQGVASTDQLGRASEARN